MVQIVDPMLVESQKVANEWYRRAHRRWFPGVMPRSIKIVPDGENEEQEEGKSKGGVTGCAFGEMAES
jgi:hypothetical protein